MFDYKNRPKPASVMIKALVKFPSFDYISETVTLQEDNVGNKRWCVHIRFEEPYTKTYRDVHIDTFDGEYVCDVQGFSSKAVW